MVFRLGTIPKNFRAVGSCEIECTTGAAETGADETITVATNVAVMNADHNVRVDHLAGIQYISRIARDLGRVRPR